MFFRLTPACLVLFWSMLVRLQKVSAWGSSSTFASFVPSELSNRYTTSRMLFRKSFFETERNLLKTCFCDFESVRSYDAVSTWKGEPENPDSVPYVRFGSILKLDEGAIASIRRQLSAFCKSTGRDFEWTLIGRPRGTPAFEKLKEASIGIQNADRGFSLIESELQLAQRRRFSCYQDFENESQGGEFGWRDVVLLESPSAVKLRRGFYSVDNLRWSVEIVFLRPGPFGVSASPLDQPLELGPVSIRIQGADATETGTSNPSRDPLDPRFSTVALAPFQEGAAQTCIGLCREGLECGRDECGVPCPSSCRDGWSCDESQGRCWRPTQPGSCANAWILMQLGVDEKGNSFVLKESDLVRTIGGNVDQSKTYRLPSRRRHYRSINGTLSGKVGRSRFPPTCSDKNGRTVYYVFETTELTGVVVEAKGRGSATRWGNLDLVLEIKKFDDYCSPVKDLPRKGKPELPKSWCSKQTIGKNSTWFFPFSEDDRYGSFKHCHYETPCNDDGGPASPKGRRGWGSRVESWLYPGIYVVVLSGRNYGTLGDYVLEFWSHPQCLPSCNASDCGTESSCGTSCGSCSADPGLSRCGATGECSDVPREAGSEPPTKTCEDRVTKCLLPRSALNSELSKKAFTTSHSCVNCKWVKVPDSMVHKEPDLVVGFEVDQPPARFRWTLLNSTAYFPSYCVVRKGGSETPCFLGRGWRLMMIPNYYVINAGGSAFSLNHERDDEENWLWSKCCQYKEKMKMNLGFLGVSLSLLLDGVSEDNQAPKSNLHKYAYRGKRRPSKRAVYHSRTFVKEEGEEKGHFVPSGMVPLSSEITLPVGGGFFSRDSDGLPCEWIDVTEEFDAMTQIISRPGFGICGCSRNIEISVETNPKGLGYEKRLENNSVKSILSFDSIPLDPRR